MNLKPIFESVDILLVEDLDIYDVISHVIVSFYWTFLNPVQIID